jgi:hypothetical protein
VCYNDEEYPAIHTFVSERAARDGVKIPNVAQAIVPERKMTDYLLSLTHRDGRSKATFFLRFGFTADEWEDLADALRRHAADYDIAEREDTPFGTSYAVEGRLLTPDGRSPQVRVVWFIETGETIPRLVTAYPLKGTRDD